MPLTPPNEQQQQAQRKQKSNNNNPEKIKLMYKKSINSHRAPSQNVGFGASPINKDAEGGASRGNTHQL
jgi:hypothetical protein